MPDYFFGCREQKATGILQIPCRLFELSGSIMSININSHKIHCKIRNYIYLLTCKICGIQHVGESITPVNLRMNIHRICKSGCEHSINHYKNICKGASFSIHILERDGFINGQRDFALQNLGLQ